ncbi:MAG: nitroreductase [Spirochaetales bacterium]|nr:MAG: nitroreductase [Spirochaetales bacterium]
MSFYTELLKKRISVRSYGKKDLDSTIKKRIGTILSASSNSPFGSGVRFSLLETSDKEREELKKLGTYGMISGAPAFIIGAVVLSDMAMEDYGYCLEKIILQLTDLGLGTCWLGGTFRRSGFAEYLKPGENEVMPAITPVGYPSDKPGLKERVIRKAIGARNRKPREELFFTGDPSSPVPVKPFASGGNGILKGYDAALEAVRLGPSASNKQPWRIFRAENEKVFRFFLKPTPGYGTFIKNVSFQDLDLGIAMCHFELTAAEEGCSGSWQREADAPAPEGMKYIASWIDNDD